MSLDELLISERVLDWQLGSYKRSQSDPICLLSRKTHIPSIFSHSHYLSTYTPMQKVACELSTRLQYVSKRSFGRMLMDAASNPIKERVVSTPQWPVPYYQRVYKAYPVRQEKKVNLSASPSEAEDYNWWSAKNILNQTLKGRQLVQHTENHIKTNTYLIKRDDCEAMARAYVDDISQFISMANRENVRILSGKTLI